MRKFPHIYQTDAMDCGPTCLSMISKYYGKVVHTSSFRSKSGIGKEGVSMLGLSEAAESVGMQTLCAKITIRQLANEIVLPCILHWDMSHYVVCYKIKRSKGRYIFCVSDPAVGKSEYTVKDLYRHWISGKFEGESIGLAMQLEPGLDFYKQNSKHNNAGGFGLKYFLRYILPYKWQILQILFGTMAVMVMGYFTPLISQAVVDIGVVGRNLQFILLMMIIQLVIAVSSTSIVFLQSWISLHMNTLININIVADYLKKLSHMPISFFETRTMGDILQRIGDHDRIKDFLMNDLIGIIFAISTFVTFSIVLCIYNWQILCVFFFGNALYIVWVMFFMKYRRELDCKSFKEASALQNNMVQFIQGMHEIKLNGIEQQKNWEWIHLQARLYKLSRKGLKIGQVQSAGSLLFSSITGIAISYIAANKVVSGEMSLGMMVSLSFIIGQVSGPIGSFVGFVQSYQDAKISLERLSDLHQHKDERQNDSHNICLEPSSSNIFVEDVYFSYTGKERKWALQGVSLFIPEGKVTAIVGASGCGKTTLLKLLQGFYEPTKGKILVGDVPMDYISVERWRKKLGVSMQDGYIFSDTIANNIAVYETPINNERLKYAVELVNLTDLVKELPNGLNTKIGVEGLGLSQGQRQRILLARSIYKNPKYLFLDEATNALDAQNETDIVYRLKSFFSYRTVVIAAHRLNTIRNADNIVVMENGTIKEQGTHSELLKNKSTYYNLIKAQLN